MNKYKAVLAAKKLQLLNAPFTDVMFHGYSMQPLLTEGDHVTSEPVSFADIAIGDIITYLHDDKYPTRRVAYKRDDHLGLWCDNWPERRFSTKPDMVLTRVTSRTRNGNTLSHSDKDWLSLTSKAQRTYRSSQIKRVLQRLYRQLSRP